MIDTRITEGFNITCHLVDNSQPVNCSETGTTAITQQTVLLSYSDDYLIGNDVMFTVTYSYQLCQDSEATIMTGMCHDDDVCLARIVYEPLSFCVMLAIVKPASVLVVKKRPT